MVPRYIFEEWGRGNFTIPVDAELRVELRKKLEGYLISEVVRLPQNRQVYKILRARVMALRAYDAECDTE